MIVRKFSDKLAYSCKHAIDNFSIGRVRQRIPATVGQSAIQHRKYECVLGIEVCGSPTKIGYIEERTAASKDSLVVSGNPLHDVAFPVRRGNVGAGEAKGGNDGVCSPIGHVNVGRAWITQARYPACHTSSLWRPTCL